MFSGPKIGDRWKTVAALGLGIERIDSLAKLNGPLCSLAF